MKRIYKAILVVPVLLALTACATDDPNKRAKTGAGIGLALFSAIKLMVTTDQAKW